MTTTGSRPVSLASFLLLAGVLLSSSAAAESAPPTKPPPPGLPAQLSQAPIDHDDPTRSVPPAELGSKNPLEWGYVLMDLSHYGDHYFERKEYAKAVPYFFAASKMVPERSVPFSRICASYVGMGDLEQAREACHEALFRTGAKPHDYERYLRLFLETRPKPTPQDLAKVDSVFQHLAEQNIVQPELEHLRCEVGLRVEDVARVEACVAGLVSRWPEDARTVTFQWSLAMLKKDATAAEGFVHAARRTPMKPQGIARMEQATAELRKAGASTRHVWPLAAGTLTVGAAVLLLGRLRRVRAPAA